jgi:protein SCO1/2
MKRLLPGFVILLVLLASCSAPAVKKDTPVDSVFDSLKPLEVIFPIDTVEPAGDSLYKAIRKQKLVMQNGDSICQDELTGKVYAVNFFFTSCKTICPKMTNYLTYVQRFYKNEPRFGMVSFSVDPERDSVPAMEAYAKLHGIEQANWKLLTGNKKVIYGLARYSYRVDAGKGDGGPEDFIHSEQVVLVDAQRKIRGYYDGTDSLELNRMIDDIGTLLNGKK